MDACGAFKHTHQDVPHCFVYSAKEGLPWLKHIWAMEAQHLCIWGHYGILVNA